ncbi:transcript variant X3, partial [Nothobranchius furzeri]
SIPRYPSTAAITQRLNAFQQRCLRRILHISYLDHITNEAIHHQTRTRQLAEVVAERRFRFGGHVLRMAQTRIPKVAMLWTPGRGKRKQGRPKITWRRTFIEDLRAVNLSWDEAEAVAADRARWRLLCAQCAKGEFTTVVSFSISGLSLDHQTVSTVSRVRLIEREEESLSCFLRSCDAALCYLQELDKMVTTPHAKTAKASFLLPPVDVDLGYFLQAALQSAYICLLQRGHLAQGAHQLRRVLRVVESRGSQSFRKCAAMKLAQVLLNSVREDSYWPPLGPPPAAWLTREGAAASKDAVYPTVKPPQRYSTDCCFCPQDVVEEAVLLLLITESMTSGEAVISCLPDQSTARQTSLQNATSVYDLLTISMARRGQYAMLSEVCQK